MILSQTIRKSTPVHVCIFSMVLCLTSSVSFFQIIKSYECAHTHNSNTCKDWLIETNVSHYQSRYANCFPGDTHVLSTDGPMKMRDIKIGDEILSLNHETGKTEFSRVTAWLNWDPYAQLDFTAIKTQSQARTHTFLSSDMHNIAYKDTHGLIHFAFARNLHQNLSLVGVGNQQHLKIRDVSHKQQKTGLYSPLTQLGTLFIFPQESQDPASGPMVLVHCLSHVQHPIEHESMVQTYINICSYLGGNPQPKKEQVYSHSLLGQAHFLFGSDWVDGKTIVKYTATVQGHQTVPKNAMTRGKLDPTQDESWKAFCEVLVYMRVVEIPMLS